VAPATASQPKTLLWRLSQWAPFRLLCFAGAIMVVAIAAKILTLLLVPPLPSPMHEPLTLVRNCLLPIAMFGVYALLVRILEHRAATELAIRKGAPALVAGSVIGTLLMATVYLILFGLGSAKFAPGTGLNGFAYAMLHTMAAAMGEELLFRAVLFRIIEEVSGTTVALVISAAIFGILHAANPGATAFSIVALTLEAGILLALAYALTRNIWLAVGIHMSWNFTQGYVFGAEVSGNSQPYSILKASMSGSGLLTGGSFGPEGSVIALGVSAVASAIMIALILRKRRWQPPRLQLRQQVDRQLATAAGPDATY
jgi:membrane protease YdiL (CAAX protease family)